MSTTRKPAEDEGGPDVLKTDKPTDKPAPVEVQNGPLVLLPDSKPDASDTA